MRAVITAIRANERAYAATLDHQQAGIHGRLTPRAASAARQPDPPEDQSAWTRDSTPHGEDLASQGRVSAPRVVPVPVVILVFDVSARPAHDWPRQTG